MTRTPFVFTLAAASAAMGALLPSCNRASSGNAATTDAGDAAAAGDAAPSDGAASPVEASAPRAAVRVAQWSPDAPEVDVCLSTDPSFAHETPRLGSLGFGPDASAESGDSSVSIAGLAFPLVSSYLIVPPANSYAVRLVAAGATSCDTSIVDLPSVSLGSGTHTTIAAVGERTPKGMDPPLKLISWPDDVTAPDGQIDLRFINASPSTITVDVGTDSIMDSLFSALFAGVGFGKAAAAANSDAGTVDANGYLAMNALSGATISAHASMTATDIAVASDVTIASGSAATMALVGGVAGTSSTAQLLLCFDADGGGRASPLSSCTIVSAASDASP